MRAERVIESGILASVRDCGTRTLAEAVAVILENDGALSELVQVSPRPDSALSNAPNADQQALFGIWLRRQLRFF